METVFHHTDSTYMFQILNNQRPVSVHVHSIENNKLIIKEIPFTVNNNIITAVMPANTEIIDGPHMLTEYI